MTQALVSQSGLCRLQMTLVSATYEYQLLKRESRETQKANSGACLPLLCNSSTASRQCQFCLDRSSDSSRLPRNFSFFFPTLASNCCIILNSCSTSSNDAALDSAVASLQLIFVTLFFQCHLILLYFEDCLSQTFLSFFTKRSLTSCSN